MTCRANMGVGAYDDAMVIMDMEKEVRTAVVPDPQVTSTTRPALGENISMMFSMTGIGFWHGF